MFLHFGLFLDQGHGIKILPHLYVAGRNTIAVANVLTFLC